MDTVDQIYLNIAQSIVDEIKDNDWSEAIIIFDYFGDSGEFDSVYKSTNEEVVDFDTDFAVYKNFKKLHEITTEDNSNKWNRAKFTLYPTGKFNIEFEWDQDLADEIEANS